MTVNTQTFVFLFCNIKTKFHLGRYHVYFLFSVYCGKIYIT